ncbi:hypothetical protein PAXRUDRAFT_161276, partial [Paxillus rubicundulus Ve08.2h10]
ASHDIILKPDLYFLYPTGDSPVLVYWDGMVGHCGEMIQSPFLVLGGWNRVTALCGTEGTSPNWEK